MTRPPHSVRHWYDNLPAGHVLACIASGGQQTDGYRLRPSGCLNRDVFAGPNGPAMLLHGRTQIGARPIGYCVACWDEADKLYAVTKLDPKLRSIPSYWSVGWMPVNQNPDPPAYIEDWWMFEYTATYTPIDTAAKTLKLA